MRGNRIVASVLGAAVIVGGINIAVYAANGQPLLLGRTNTETSPAVVKNTGNGAALALRTRSSAPPLTVSSGKKVRKLNADKVDGFSAKALQSRPIVLRDTDLTTVREDFITWSLEAVPDGAYHVWWDVNFQPLPDANDVVCAVTTNSFSRQFAAERESGEGGWIATWLSGSALIQLDADDMQFFCQTSAPSLQLKGPLTIAFQKVDGTRTPPFPVTSRPVPRSSSRAGAGQVR